jgi:hypothetical protein
MRLHLPLLFSLSAALTNLSVAAADTPESAPDLLFHVNVELGASQFAPGDNIAITEVRGTKATIGVDGTYTVVGTYQLSSTNEALLCFYSTIPNSGLTPTDPKQIVQIHKGAGQFRLIKTVAQDGFLHLGFYPLSDGQSFGNLYFGQSNWILRELWPDKSTASASSTANAALFKFLGDPIPPPEKLAAAYSRQGLYDAVTLAAKNAGVDLKTLIVDDSEFPYLVGVVASPGTLEKLKEQFKKMEAYHYSGSVSSESCYAFNITPSNVFPPGLERLVHRRMTLRMDMIYEKMQGEE